MYDHECDQGQIWVQKMAPIDKTTKIELVMRIDTPTNIWIVQASNFIVTSDDYLDVINNRSGKNNWKYQL